MAAGPTGSFRHWPSWPTGSRRRDDGGHDGPPAGTRPGLSSSSGARRHGAPGKRRQSDGAEGRRAHPHAAARELSRGADLPGRPRGDPPLLQRARRAPARPPLRRDGRDAARRVDHRLHADCRGREPTTAGRSAARGGAPEMAPGPSGHSHSGPRWSGAADCRHRATARRAGRAPSGRGGHLLGGALAVRVTLWGTRGSLAAAGPETVRYGGNTSCVEVRAADGSVLVLDAGTGMRRLGVALRGENRRLDVLLSHLHMDHIQGLGFFAPFFEEGREIHVWGPPSTTEALRERLTRYLSPPLFPVRLRELPCRLTLHDVAPAAFGIGPFQISAALVCHPGPTVGYRITADRATLAYIPDHEPALGLGRLPAAPDWISGFAIAADADVLIHDAQYSDAEYLEHIGWGHSALTHAFGLATAAGVGRLVTFHHDPGHDDVTLTRLLEEAR